MGDNLKAGGITSLIKRRSGAGRLIPYVGRTQWSTKGKTAKICFTAALHV